MHCNSDKFMLKKTKKDSLEEIKLVGINSIKELKNNNNVNSIAQIICSWGKKDKDFNKDVGILANLSTVVEITFETSTLYATFTSTIILSVSIGLNIDIAFL